MIEQKGTPVVYHYGNSDKTQITVIIRGCNKCSSALRSPYVYIPLPEIPLQPFNGLKRLYLEDWSSDGWMGSFASG